jgi:hypothetical protein
MSECATGVGRVIKTGMKRRILPAAIVGIVHAQQVYQGTQY